MFFLLLFGWEFATLKWEIINSILLDMFEIRSENNFGEYFVKTYAWKQSEWMPFKLLGNSNLLENYSINCTYRWVVYEKDGLSPKGQDFPFVAEDHLLTYYFAWKWPVFEGEVSIITLCKTRAFIMFVLPLVLFNIQHPDIINTLEQWREFRSWKERFYGCSATSFSGKQSLNFRAKIVPIDLVPVKITNK